MKDDMNTDQDNLTLERLEQSVLEAGYSLQESQRAAEQAESAYTSTQSNEAFEQVLQAKQRHLRAELDLRAAKNALHTEQVAQWSAIDKELRAQIVVAVREDREFEAASQSDIDELFNLTAGVIEVVERIEARRDRARQGCSLANQLLQTLYLHSKKSPDYVPPAEPLQNDRPSMEFGKAPQHIAVWVTGKLRERLNAAGLKDRGYHHYIG